ncbi:hypothetical protein F0L68_17585 [Solihabitans fulvus]|uniref:Uncharacterized protein n=1 Tax=Solihabitans fulvus TaxID=1892852 RepID=A0A5B2XC37_9PSEU|nr:hypothetical protein [Solihabitans fulvus]KAA2261268.1 hypothetical protein F0L68_17585 [Solihabitans fulvus]
MSDPIFVSIAATLASRAAIGLYNLVKAKFADDPDATAVLEAAENAKPDSPEVKELGSTLERKERADAEFGERLRTEWEKTTVTQHAESGGVVNQITGNVSGKVLQARDIQGGVSF